MTTPPPEDQIQAKVQEAVAYVNAMYERLIVGQASEEEANLINAIAAEGLLNGRGAALTRALDLFQRLKVN
jgi:hypothetical protein